jgi:hypothetical protein
VDVPPEHWAAATIDESVAMGFLTGYPAKDFRPNQIVPRVQVVNALAVGLSLPKSASPEMLLQPYQDWRSIPAWAQDPVASAIAADIIRTASAADSQLRPNDAATRAEVAAIIYASLAYMGKVSRLPQME